MVVVGRGLMRLEKGGWLGGKFNVCCRVLDWGVYGFGCRFDKRGQGREMIG